VRRKVSGTVERPRMAIMRSNKHIHVQFIDDAHAVTLAAVSSVGTDVNVNVEGAKALGLRAAEEAAKKGIRRVVVDRGGFAFRGRLRALVEAMEGAGITTRSAPATQDREEQ
jgi:large subunit ribosomal protein L18